MAESQILGVLRLWAAVAWADGVMAEREADALKRLIAAAGLSPEEAALADAMLKTETPLPDELAADALTVQAKEGIYRAACRMALMDQQLAETERAMLDRLQARLDIGIGVALRIENEVGGMA